MHTCIHIHYSVGYLILLRSLCDYDDYYSFNYDLIIVIIITVAAAIIASTIIMSTITIMENEAQMIFETI